MQTVEDIFEGEVMLQETKLEKYLGDIISDDGKNHENVNKRRNRGNGLVKEINAMLVELMLGGHHFEVAMLVRNSCLISSLLVNCEAWYGLTKKDEKTLEKVDEQLLRKILNCPAKTPKYLMYLELGCIPISFIIKSRRINYLKYILDQPEDSLMRKVFEEQNKNSKCGDWVNIVKKDIKKLNINLTFKEIQEMSKSAVGKLVKEKVEAGALKYLTSQIKEKGKEINYIGIKMQSYLKVYSPLSIQEKQETFKMRSKMTNIKMNMKNKYETFYCDACKKINAENKETKSHILNCQILNEGKQDEVQIGNIFKNNLEKIKIIVNIFMKNMKEREKFRNPK